MHPVTYESKRVVCECHPACFDLANEIQTALMLVYLDLPSLPNTDCFVYKVVGLEPGVLHHLRPILIEDRPCALAGHGNQRI